MRWKKKGLIIEPQNKYEWWSSHAAVPVADKIGDDTYRVYFNGRNTQNKSQTGYAEININNPECLISLTTKPILRLGKIGCFDDSGVMISCIVHHNNEQYLYFSGWNIGVSVPFRNSIGLAISHDNGQSFIKYSDGPIMDRSVHDPFFATNPFVLVESGIWRMWYISCVDWKFDKNGSRHCYHIKYAESTDGIQWLRDGIICIDFKSDKEYAISRPCIVKDNGLYKMWYSYRGDHYRIGYAESGDGIVWQRMDERAGIEVSDTGWDSEMVEYAFVFNNKGRHFMLYNGNDFGRTGIGIAELVDK